MMKVRHNQQNSVEPKKTEKSWWTLKVCEFCSETTAHGLSYIREKTSHPLKIFWLLAFAACLIPTYLGFKDVITQYKAGPMTSNYILLTPENLTIPNFIACSPYVFDRRKINALNISKNLMTLISTTLIGFDYPIYARRNLSNLPDLMSEEMMREYANLMRNFQLKTFDDLMDRISFACEDILESCLDFEQDYYPNCCNFSMRIFTVYGMRCLQFPRQVQRVSSQQLLINFKFPTNADIYRTSFTGWPLKTFILSFTSSNIIQLELSTVVYAEAGRLTTIFLGAKKMRSVNNPPKYVCVENENFDNGTQFQCIQRCLSRPQVEACGCRTAFSVLVDDPLCDINQTISCGLKYASGSKMMQTDRILSCHQHCVMPCEIDTYTIRKESGPFDVENLKVIWGEKHEEKVEEIAQNAVMVSIAFPIMGIDQLDQSLAITLGRAVSYIGGQSGLFFGGSILTVAHMIVFLLHCFYLSAKRRLFPTEADQIGDDK